MHKESKEKPFMLRKPETISENDVKNLFKRTMSLKMKALLCVSYGTGARVSEINQIKMEDIYKQTLKDPQGKDVEYVTFSLITLKKRGAQYSSRRNALIRSDETWITKPIVDYVRQKFYRHKLAGRDVLFPHHRVTIYKWLKKNTMCGRFPYGINPHGFRKLRATHLARPPHNFTEKQLEKFFGWADARPASFYVSLRTDDIAY